MEKCKLYEKNKVSDMKMINIVYMLDEWKKNEQKYSYSKAKSEKYGG